MVLLGDRPLAESQFIYVLRKYLLDSFFVPGIAPAPINRPVNTNSKVPVLLEIKIP
jgi:hypothetical protein